MRRPHEAPRPGSRAYRVLQGLHKNGALATLNELMSFIDFDGSIAMFERDIVGVLVRNKHIFQRENVYVLTDSGKNHIGQVIDIVIEPSMVAGPRYVAPKRDLSSGNRPKVMLTREGAFAYRDIPSRYGDKRISYTTSLNVPAGDAQA